MKQKILAVLLSFCCMISVTACGQSGPAFDAGTYTKGCLDAFLKKTFSEEYLKYSDSTEDEAKQAYEDSLDADVEALISESDNVSTALKKKYRDMFVQIYKNMKYEIGNVKDNKDGTYSVTVKTYRLIVFKNTIGPVEDYYASLSSKKQKKYTEEKLQMMIVDNVIDNMKTLEYDETPLDVTITVAPVENKKDQYAIDSEDYQRLYAAMMDGSEWAGDDSDDSAESTDSTEATATPAAN